MLEFHRRTTRSSGSITLFPGAFNPPTRAHLAMALASLDFSAEVVFVLPREFPHKDFSGPGFTQRLEMLMRVCEAYPAFSVASCQRGLFIDVARAARAAGESQERIYLLCGADAAQRILEWDYGGEDGIEQQLEEYELLVAPRLTGYAPPATLAPRIHSIAVSAGHQQISSTAVRLGIARGSNWRDWVPEEIAGLVERLYS